MTRIRTLPPSLADQRDWFAYQAEHAPTAYEREQWKMLATELAHRLNDDGPEPDNQPTLF